MCVSLLTLLTLNFQGQSTCSTPASARLSRPLRFGAVVVIVGAVLMLCASVATLYLQKGSDKNVSVEKRTAVVIALPLQ